MLTLRVEVQMTSINSIVCTDLNEDISIILLRNTVGEWSPCIDSSVLEMKRGLQAERHQNIFIFSPF